jgi:hypothetical protein
MLALNLILGTGYSDRFHDFPLNLHENAGIVPSDRPRSRHSRSLLKIRGHLPMSFERNKMIGQSEPGAGEKRQNPVPSKRKRRTWASICTNLYSEDRSGRFFLKFGDRQHDYMVSQKRGSKSKFFATVKTRNMCFVF